MDALARTLFEISPAGIMLLRPIYDEQQVLLDLACEQANSAAQQMLQLPAQPLQTLRQLYPHAVESGLLAFYQEVVRSGETCYYEGESSADGLSSYYRLAAQRSDDHVVVIFTDTAHQHQGDMAAALQLSHQRELQARAETERQRQLLQQVFERAPVPMAIFQGPDYEVELANSALAGMWGKAAADLVGQPFFRALPDLRSQGFEEILAGVWRTGETFTAQELTAVLNREHTGRPALAYFNLSYQALRDGADGRPTGIIAVAIEVTEQVNARQQVLQLNHRLEAAQAETERQRRELQRVLEQAPVAIAVYRGPQFIIELANPTVCRLWGRTQAQVVGLPLFEALPEVAGMGYEELLTQVMTTGVPHVAHAMEAVHEREGRRDTVYWDFVYVPMYEEDGSVYGAMVVATEVTEQVRARQQIEQLNQQLETRVQERTRQLAEQQMLLRQILGQVPAAIATLNGPTHRYTFFNEQYQHLVAGRAQPEQALGEALPELAGQEFFELLQQVYATGQLASGVAAPVRLYSPATGRPELHYLDFIYQPLTDSQGQLHDVLVFILDVTERVQARQQTEALQAELLAVAQRQAQERQDLYHIFEQAPVAIVLRAPDHRIEYFNPAYAQLFPGRELQGHPMAESQPEVAASGFVALLNHVYQTGETYYGTEQALNILQPNGSLRTHYFNFTYQAYREQGSIVGVFAFVYDVTEQVLVRRSAAEQVLLLNEELAAINEELQSINEELNTSNSQLLRTNADLDSFVYTASHDLKAPIANIEGLLYALRQDLPPELVATEAISHLLNLMDNSIFRFQQTIGHLTSITQLQRAGSSLAEDLDLAKLVEGVRLDLAPSLEAARAQLSVDLSECPNVHFAAKDLRSIIFNLLSNAIKYRALDRPPLVRLRAACTSQRVLLTVQDNGLGLTPEQQGKLFGLFRRLHTHVEGSGVGLYSIKKLVENAGGTITVTSELGVGSTFSVLLPR